MGLFDKRSAEEKEFDKAYKAAMGKPGPKTFPKLEAACNNYAPGWQGWLLMGLCYDCGVGVKRDAAKAAECHKRAKASGAEWPQMFYFYYDRSGGNLYMGDLCDSVLALRRLGAAAMSTLDMGEQHLTKGILESDDNFFRAIFANVDTGGLFRSTDEQKQAGVHGGPFLDWLAGVREVKKNEEDEELYKMRSRDFYKAIKQIQKETANTICSSDADEWLYVAGMSLLLTGRYGGFVYDFSNKDRNDRIRTGIVLLWQAADLGNISAMLMLEDLAESDEFRPVVIHTSPYADHLITLITLLSLAAERDHAGTKEAMTALMQIMARM